MVAEGWDRVVDPLRLLQFVLDSDEGGYHLFFVLGRCAVHLEHGPVLAEVPHASIAPQPELSTRGGEIRLFLLRGTWMKATNHIGFWQWNSPSGVFWYAGRYRTSRLGYFGQSVSLPQQYG